MKLKALKGLIFDIHRTLVDDSGFPRERIWKLIRDHGVHFSMDEYYNLYDKLTKELFRWDKISPFIKIRDIHKLRLQKIYQIFNVKRNIDKDVEFLWNEMGRCKIYPEVTEVLNVLSTRYRICLLTNADDDDPLIRILEGNGFSFHKVITSESVGAYKPSPILFETSLKHLNCRKNEVLMIGDSLLSDVLGAHNFGIKVVWIDRKFRNDTEHYPTPDYHIHNLKQLYDII